ncbi:hypothetical protein [Spiroplasma endosymbiont of Othius punctulatus]|uniref:hypothetical protein n=1 Tax=Spiroplasma endosymbiont of Othius punctulatus TaxID=3066289 RepID=UPI0030D4FBFD
MVIKKIECTRFGKATFMALNQIETHTVNSELYLDKLEKLSLDKSKNIKLTKTTIEVKEPQQISRSIKFDDLKNLISQINKKLRLNIWGEDSQIERMLFVNIEHYYMDNTIFWKNLVVDYVKSYGSKYKDKFRRPVDYVLDNLINPLSIEVAFLFLELKPKDDVGFLVDKCINFKKIKNNKEFIIEEVGIFSANYRPHMDASLKKIINKNKK